MFLLDTTHCSSAILGNTQILKRLAELKAKETTVKGRSKTIATCSSVAVELIDMAACSQQRQVNLALVRRFLLGLYVYPIAHTTYNFYYTLRSRLFQYVSEDRLQPHKNRTVAQLGVSDNNLWIAAIAIEHQLTLLTTDKDFLRIQAVQTFDLDSWV